MRDIPSVFQTVSDRLVKVVGSRYFYWFILTWFILQSATIAVVTEFAVPPDENFHFNLIKLYAERGGTPFLSSQEGYYWLGDVTRRGSILSHYLLSWPYRLFEGMPNTYVYLRFINVGFAAGALLLVKRLARQLGLSDFTANLSLFMLVNTLMFVFLSAAISYDNPLIMLSMLSLVLLVSLMQDFRTHKLLWLGTVMLAASVVKFTFLPLMLFIVLALLMYHRKSLRDKAWVVLGDIRNGWRTWRVLLVLVLLLGSGALAVERYGVNLVEYGRVKVGCEQVHQVEDCRASPLFRRGERIAAMDKQPAHSVPGFALRWAVTTKERIYGIFAHQTTRAATAVIYGTWVIVGVMALALVRKYRWKGRPLDYLLGISLAYVAVVAAKNFSGYMDHGIFGMALQGRYIFPVLPVLYLAGTHYVTVWFGKKYAVLSIYTVLVLAVFIIAGLPSYLYLAGPAWYAERMPSWLETLVLYLT